MLEDEDAFVLVDCLPHFADQVGLGVGHLLLGFGQTDYFLSFASGHVDLIKYLKTLIANP